MDSAIKKLHLFLLSLIICMFMSACFAGHQDKPKPLFVDPTLGVMIAGNKYPAVVLQAGLQDGKASWSDVFDSVARDNTVVAFDRPGHSRVPATKGPRDPCTIAREQKELLRAAKISPPYILVGHSLGGLYQYVYAKLYPEDVAGLILLDPTHPKHWETMQTEAPA